MVENPDWELEILQIRPIKDFNSIHYSMVNSMYTWDQIQKKDTKDNSKDDSKEDPPHNKRNNSNEKINSFDDYDLQVEQELFSNEEDFFPFEEAFFSEPSESLKKKDLNAQNGKNLKDQRLLLLSKIQEKQNRKELADTIREKRRKNLLESLQINFKKEKKCKYKKHENQNLSWEVFGKKITVNKNSHEVSSFIIIMFQKVKGRFGGWGGGEGLISFEFTFYKSSH